MTTQSSALYAHLLTSPERRNILLALEDLMQDVWAIQSQNLAQGDVDAHVSHLEQIMRRAGDLSRDLNVLIGDARTLKFRVLKTHEEG